ncbi:hypothetical protein ACHAPT_006765 [Fusarium lateritium]
MLGTVSAAMALTTTTIQGVRALASALDRIKEAPQTITNIKVELHNVQSIIENLQAALQQGDRKLILDGLVKGSIEATLKTCSDSCERFHTEVEKLLEHSSKSGLSLRGKLTVGIFARGRITAFIDELEAHKSTINLALNGANLLVCTGQPKQRQLPMVQGSNQAHLRDAGVDDQYPTAADMQKRAQLAKGYQDLLALLQNKVAEARADIEVSNIEGLNSARILAGAKGEGSNDKIKVNNVKADGGSLVTGFSGTMDFDAIFK